MNTCSKFVSTAFGLVSLLTLSQANAEIIAARWTSACSDDVFFTLDLQPVPYLEPLFVYTLNGMVTIPASTPSGFARYPVQGGVTYDILATPVPRFRVSLFYSSAIGISFAYAANLTPPSLRGTGSLLITSDRGIGSCGGQLEVVAPETME